jgi:AraC family transcriptional regulator, regulatory protein of adaptative response / methylated-DNA-[protein]-cysteine methyltransferase
MEQISRNMKKLPFGRKGPAMDEIRKASEEIHYASGRTSLGAVLLGTGDRGVAAILMGDDDLEVTADLQERFPHALLVPGGREEKNLLQKVIDFIERPYGDLDLPLDIRGTVFQRKVWQAVREIPFGHTATYTEIARKIGAPKAMRAVGTACAGCLLSLAIPCHRVLRSDGSLAGSIRQGPLIEREAKAFAGKQPGEG